MSVFDANIESLQQLVFDDRVPVKIGEFIHQNVVKKYCSLCSHFNIDQLDPLALASVILLMCKSRDGWKVCADFLQQYPGTSIQLESKLTDSVVEEGGGRKLHQMSEEIFSSISDWTTLLEYVDVELAEADLEFIQENAIMARLRDSLRDAGLVQDAMPEPHFMVLCVLYMSPRSTPAAKMVERLCMRVDDKHTDVELKCMRFVTSFCDAPMDEQAQNRLYIRLCQCVVVKPAFFDQIRRSLSDALAVEMQTATDTKRPNQVQLRYLAANIHNTEQIPYTQTFDNWRTQHKFGNTTSIQLQRLLYFIQVQDTATPEDVYVHLFTRDVLQRVRSKAIEQIDVKAVIEIVKGLRVYHNGIADLIDFRTECLHGLSISHRKVLTLSNVAQLYVCVFQHDSVWEQCWKSIVPVVNHTIISARDRFRQTHIMNTAAVVQNIINCHVNLEQAVALKQPPKTSHIHPPGEQETATAGKIDF